MTQEFSSVITPINDSEIAPKAVQQTLFWVAVGVYSLLLLTFVSYNIVPNKSAARFIPNVLESLSISLTLTLI